VTSRLLIGLGIVHILWIFFFVIGRLALATRPLDSDSELPEERCVVIAVSTATGAAIFLLSLFLVATLGFLTPLGVSIDSLALLLVVTIAQGKRLRDPRFVAIDLARPLLGCLDAGWIVCYCFALPTVMLALLPVSGFDTTLYHLAHAVDWARAGRLTVDPFLRFPLFAYNFELLFSLFFVYRLDAYVQLAAWMTLAWCTTGTYAVARLVLMQSGTPSKWASTGAILAAACFAFFPPSLQFANECYIDIPAGFMFVAAIAAAVLALREPSRYTPALAVIGGSFVGFKLTLAPYLLLFAFLIVALNMPRPNRMRAIAYLATFFIVASPWYIRNLVLAGDPLSPTLNELLNRPDPFWSRGDYQSVLSLMRQTGIANTVLRPVLLFSHDGSPAISVLFLYLPICALAVDLWRRRSVLSGPSILNVAAAYAVTAAILTSTMYSRYLLQFYGVYLAAIVVTFFRLASWLLVIRGRVRRPLTSRALAVCSVLALAVPSPESVTYVRSTLASTDSIRDDVEHPTAYLSVAKPGYVEVADVIEILRSGKSDGRVLALGHESTAFYFRRSGIVSVGDWFGPGRYADLRAAVDSNSLDRYLARLHIAAVVERDTSRHPGRKQILNATEQRSFESQLNSALFVDRSRPVPDGTKEFVRRDVLRRAQMSGFGMRVSGAGVSAHDDTIDLLSTFSRKGISAGHFATSPNGRGVLVWRVSSDNAETNSIAVLAGSSYRAEIRGLGPRATFDSSIGLLPLAGSEAVAWVDEVRRGRRTRVVSIQCAPPVDGKVQWRQLLVPMQPSSGISLILGATVSGRSGPAWVAFANPIVHRGGNGLEDPAQDHREK
jgi:hypothetical protein